MNPIDKIFILLGAAVALLVAVLILIVIFLELILKWVEPRSMYLSDKIKYVFWKAKEKFNDK